MSDKKIQKAQENELEYLKTIYGHSNVEDLRSNGDDEVEPLKLKILLRRHAKLDEGPVSIDLTVTCDADYPEGKPGFSLDNGQGISAESVKTLTRILDELNRTYEEYNILKLAQTVKEFLNKDKLLEPFLNPSNNINGNHNEIEQNKNNKCSVGMNTVIVSVFQQCFKRLNRLGEGAYGKVYLVEHNFDKQLYAIKTISDAEKGNGASKQHKSTLKEAQLLCRLNHKNIVRYYFTWIETGPRKSEDGLTSEGSYSTKYTSTQSEFIRNDDEATSDDEKMMKSEDINIDGDTSKCSPSQTSTQSEYIIFQNDDEATLDDEELKSDDSKMMRFTHIQMEYCANTLRKAIDTALYTDINRVWQFLREICQGLAYLHQKGIMHRDLKPDNIFIGARDQIKIGDFGLATRFRCPQEVLSQSKHSYGNGSLTTLVGTPLYMAPEFDSLNVQYDNKVDVYSLGIIIFEMSYEPLIDWSKRNSIIGDLREPSVKIPNDLLNNVVYTQNVKVIKLLLQHDPYKRPSIEELLKSKLVPPAERDITEFRKKIRNTATR